MDGLRFWKSDEIDPDEPKELVAFSNQKNIVIEWKNSFKEKMKSVIFYLTLVHKIFFLVMLLEMYHQLMHLPEIGIGLLNLIF